MATASFIWNGGTGDASSPNNWTILAGSSASTTGLPSVDDQIIVRTGDARFIDTLLPAIVDLAGGQIAMINDGSAGATAAPATVAVC